MKEWIYRYRVLCVIIVAIPLLMVGNQIGLYRIPIFLALLFTLVVVGVHLSDMERFTKSFILYGYYISAFWCGMIVPAYNEKVRDLVGTGVGEQLEFLTFALTVLYIVLMALKPPGTAIPAGERTLFAGITGICGTALAIDLYMRGNFFHKIWPTWEPCMVRLGVTACFVFLMNCFDVSEFRRACSAYRKRKGTINPAVGIAVRREIRIECVKLAGKARARRAVLLIADAPLLVGLITIFVILIYGPSEMTVDLRKEEKGLFLGGAFALKFAYYHGAYLFTEATHQQG